MGNLKDLNLLPSYHKGINNIAAEFYLPCMSCASKYDRAVGFFSSSVYIIAWPSLKDFVKRGGKIRIICSPVLSSPDISSINEGYSSRLEEKSAENLRLEIQKMMEDRYLKKPTRVLAALVAIGVIDFHIAFMNNQTDPRYRRLFHDKVGIFEDKCGNGVVFKGSMNETWAGLAADGNLDSIDVFLSWGGGQDEKRVNDEIKYFETLWKNEYPTTVVREFPKVARTELIDKADIEAWPEIVDEICSEISKAEVLSADQGVGGRIPRPHQINAINEWLKRGRKGILEHATGSGKTFTALCTIRDSINRKETPLIIVPSEILFYQWYDELKKTFKDLNPAILLCGAGKNKWRRNQLLTSWTQKSDNPRIVLAMMPTAASDDFLELIRQGEHIFLVVDEVHRIGSRKNQKILELESGPRLGLSATPQRAGDLLGTNLILEYFNGIIPPPFSLKDAINARTLTPYMYHIHTVTLFEYEQEKWDILTSKIRQLYAQNESAKVKDPLIEERINRWRIKRAKIIKEAEDKVRIASEVFKNYFKNGQKWIVYCDSFVQLNKVIIQLQKNSFDAKEYHSEMKGDRRQTLRYFDANGGILVSIRCLDEGVDIPSITHALILASSKNPREFIQRRGRLLRKAPNKNLAFVHDVIVIPNEFNLDPRSRDTIIEGELTRAIEFGKNAENSSSVYELERLAIRLGFDYSKFIEEGFEEDE